jgi:RNA polymerase sigma factor (sigma-70 family)
MDLRKIFGDIGKGGDAASGAFELFDKQFRRSIVKYLLRLRLTKADAEDVTQEIYIKVFRFSGQSSTFESPEAWLWSVVKNAALDHVRRRGSSDSSKFLFQDQDEIEQLPAPTLEVPAGAVDDCIERGVGNFFRSMPDRAAAIQMVLDGLSIREISKRIDRTEKATAQYLYESRKRLAPYVAPCGEYLGA